MYLTIPLFLLFHNGKCVLNLSQSCAALLTLLLFLSVGLFNACYYLLKERTAYTSGCFRFRFLNMTSSPLLLLHLAPPPRYVSALHSFTVSASSNALMCVLFFLELKESRCKTRDILEIYWEFYLFVSFILPGRSH